MNPALSSPPNAIAAFKQALNTLNNDCQTAMGAQRKILDTPLKQLDALIQKPLPIQKNHPLYALATSNHRQFSRTYQRILSAWQASGRMRSLSDQLDDKLTLLVYGKTNTGKSSLCDWLAQLGQRITYFVVDEHGQLQPQSERVFEVGVTETTSRLQGAIIDDALVLLDSPGLHSVTAQNGALTQEYLDAADAVLWLTSSNSPGQQQELATLAAECRTQKPLLPVITRSDLRDEDVNEAGELIARTINKSDAQRQPQIDDVQARAQQVLDEANTPLTLIKPIAISIKAQQADLAEGVPADTALQHSGLASLLEHLMDLLTQANAEKPTKVKRQAQRFIEQHLKQPLQNNVLPQVQALSTNIDQHTSQITQKTPRIHQQLQVALTQTATTLAHQFADQNDVKGYCLALNEWLTSALADILTTHLHDHLAELAPTDISIEASGLGDFTPVEAEYRQTRGKGRQAALSAAAGLSGLLLGPAGWIGLAAAAGSGLAGHLAGTGLVSTITRTEITGYDAANIINNTEQWGEKALLSHIQQSMAPIISGLSALQSLTTHWENALTDLIVAE